MFSKYMAPLDFLEMSAAFDTVNHDIFLHRLEASCGICGRELRWLTSFLTGRTQAVSYAGRTSPQCRLSCDVPQGSVLGPLLFVLYTADVIGIALGHGNLNPRRCCMTTPRYTSVAPNRIINLLPLFCWTAYRKSNRG